MQLAIATAAEEPFPQSMHKLALKPLGMTKSTYQQPLPEKLANTAASGHDQVGKPVPGKWHVYPEMAAAGLWTTASDVARYIIAVQSAFEGHSDAKLSQGLTRQMLTRQSRNGPGLGLFVFSNAAGSGFGHTGSNRGFRCKLTATSARKDGFGLVIMTNSDNGPKLFMPVEKLVQESLKKP